MKFKFDEIEKMFVDPLDHLISIANKYLSKNKIIKSIFS